MKLTKLQNNIIIVSTIFTVIASAFIGLIHTSNMSNNSEKSVELPKIIQLSLKVVCEEAEGFCELKKVLSEQPEETSVTTTTFSILHKDFHYPTFVKIYSLRKEENLTMRSHIKIADSPPPIFS